MTQLQKLINTLCAPDEATTTGGWMLEISGEIYTCEEFAAAVHEEYLDRWAEGVFRLFTPSDYHLYRVYAETIEPCTHKSSEAWFSCVECGSPQLASSCTFCGKENTQGETLPMCDPCQEPRAYCGCPSLAITTSPGER